MPFYRAIFEAAGIEVADRNGTRRWSTPSVLYGDEDGLAAKIRSFFDAGADEVVLSPFGVGDDPARVAGRLHPRAQPTSQGVD